jgi:hypothetical protein
MNAISTPPAPEPSRNILLDIIHDKRTTTTGRNYCINTTMLPRKLFLPDISEYDKQHGHAVDNFHLPPMRLRRRQQKRLRWSHRGSESAQGVTRGLLHPRFENQREGSLEAAVAMGDDDITLPILDQQWAFQHDSNEIIMRNCISNLSFRPSNGNMSLFMTPTTQPPTVPV